MANSILSLLGVYLAGAAILSIAFVAIVSTVVQFSLGTVLGIWLGAVLGGFLVFGCACLQSGNEKLATIVVFFAAMIVMILIYGVTAGVLFTGPWYYMKMHGVGDNLLASGEGARKFGTYHFNETAFVDTRFLGVKKVEAGKDKDVQKYNYYCVAPIVGSLQQGYALYWAVAYDCCQESGLPQTCWSTPYYNKTAPVLPTTLISKPALAGTIGLESDGSLYLSKNVNEALQDSLSKFRGQVDVGIPAGVSVDPSVQSIIDQRVPLWVSLRTDNPEVYRDKRGDTGVIWMAVTVGLWPLVLFCTVIILFVAAVVDGGNVDCNNCDSSSSSSDCECDCRSSSSDWNCFLCCVIWCDGANVNGASFGSSANVEKVFNRDGVETISKHNYSPHSVDHGKYVHYCGRFVGRENYAVPCEQCDGRCGPGNGCQCPACFEYDHPNQDPLSYKESIKKSASSSESTTVFISSESSSATPSSNSSSTLVIISGPPSFDEPAESLSHSNPSSGSSGPVASASSSSGLFELLMNSQSSSTSTALEDPFEEASHHLPPVIESSSADHAPVSSSMHVPGPATFDSSSPLVGSESSTAHSLPSLTAPSFESASFNSNGRVDINDSLLSPSSYAFGNHSSSAASSDLSSSSSSFL